MNRIKINYNQEVTFVIAESNGYKGNKTMKEQYIVKCIILQDIKMQNSGYSETVDADSIIYVDPENTFIQDNYYRLEGMYILSPLFNSPNSISWYRVESVAVNRDHLLDNKTDNIACLLKKTEPIAGVS